MKLSVDTKISIQYFAAFLDPPASLAAGLKKSQRNRLTAHAGWGRMAGRRNLELWESAVGGKDGC